MVRNTRQREAIQGAFLRADRPLSPGEARTLASQDVPELGLSTVYRTISALVEEGWLKTVSLPGQPDRYETAGRHHHHHFHCTLCGGVFEVGSCPGDLASMAPEGFVVQDHEVILTGWCRACAASARNGGPKSGEAARAHVHVAGCQEHGCEADHAGAGVKKPGRRRRASGEAGGGRAGGQ